MSNRQKIFFIAAIIILAGIALVEGMALWRQAAQSYGRVAAGHLAAVFPAKNAPMLPEKEDVVLQETGEDLERLHNQINRLFYEMTRDPFFAPANVRTSQAERQRRLQSEIERIFQKAHEQRHSGALNLLEKDWQNVATAASLNLEEDGTNYTVAVSLPGFEKDAINITIHNRILTIEAASRRKDKAQNSESFQSGRLQTQIMLPSGARGEAAEAIYENGILKITVPKSAASNSLARQVTIR